MSTDETNWQVQKYYGQCCWPTVGWGTQIKEIYLLKTMTAPIMLTKDTEEENVLD